MTARRNLPHIRFDLFCHANPQRDRRAENGPSKSVEAVFCHGTARVLFGRPGLEGAARGAAAPAMREKRPIRRRDRDAVPLLTLASRERRASGWYVT